MYVGVLQDGGEETRLLGSGVLGSKACLACSEDAIFFAVVGKGSGDHAGPDFINGILKADSSIVVEVVGVIFFVYKAGVAPFPCDRCVL